MSEVNTNATIFFQSEEQAEFVFTSLKPYLFDQPSKCYQPLISLGFQFLKKEIEGGFIIHQIEQKYARIRLSFMEGHVPSVDVFKNLTKLGAVLIDASIDYSSVGETENFFFKGNRKVKRDTFFDSLVKVDKGFAFNDAVSRGKLDLCQQLVGKGYDPVSDVETENPLILAVEKKKSKVVAYLLSLGFDINVVSKPVDLSNPSRRFAFEKNLTPIHIAVKAKNKPLVKLLVKYSPDLSIPDAEGRTPFMTAVAYDDIDIAAILEKSGCDVNALDFEGENALFRVIKPHTKGSSIFEKNEEYENVFTWFKYLNKLKLDFHCVSKNDENLLWRWHKDERIKPYLLEKGLTFLRPADAYNEQDGLGANFCEAMSHDDVEKLSDILDSITDFNMCLRQMSEQLEYAKNHSPEPLIILAIKYEHLSVIEQLINRDVNCNVFNSHGHYALDLAVKSNNVPLVSLLVENGADINFKYDNRELKASAFKYDDESGICANIDLVLSCMNGINHHPIEVIDYLWDKWQPTESALYVAFCICQSKYHQELEPYIPKLKKKWISILDSSPPEFEIKDLIV